MNFEIGFYLASILVLAIIHTISEVLYKNATMQVRLYRNAGNKSALKALSIPLLVIIISIGISLGVKIIYGILIGLNLLSVTAGLFLGFIAIFSILFGKIFFNEHVSSSQFLGIILIAIGITILLV